MTTGTAQRVAPYGSWKSPITADSILAGTVGVQQIELDGSDTYWIESRPQEAGRSVVVRSGPDGSRQDLTPAPYNARTRVHEYGGGAYTAHDGTVYFSNFADGRLYRQRAGEEPRAFTPEGDSRYADMVVDAPRRRIIGVREDHSREGVEATNTIVAIPLEEGGDQLILVSGADFYSTLRLDPRGRTLCWLSWNHPNLPWDGTDLWVADVEADGSLGQPRHVAGGASESIFQPSWSPDGTLYFVSDRTGWWNLYRVRDGDIEALAPMEAEFGIPQWIFGMATYGFLSPSQVVGIVHRRGKDTLYTLDTETRQYREIDLNSTVLSGIRAANGRVVMSMASPTESPAIAELTAGTWEPRVLRRTSDVEVDAGYLSVPEEIEFPTENGRTAFGIYYPPKNREYEAPPGEKPPLIVESHGGPTSRSNSALDLEIQYWTSRGFAVLDVNYGGSTGYGREYRERLNGNWGIVDVDDCVNGARYLVERRLVDGDRLIIRGGSAGGYTTLAALTFRDVFKAGASYFGVSDLEVFVHDTHKFESRYLERLVGPYPEVRDRYRERSPINFTERLSAPMILLQGLDDKVVPPSQAEIMIEGLRRQGVPYAYLPFEGEGHGFRRAENEKAAMEGELYFYSRIFGFELPEEVPGVEIHGL